VEEEGGGVLEGDGDGETTSVNLRFSFVPVHAGVEGGGAGLNAAGATGVVGVGGAAAALAFPRFSLRFSLPGPGELEETGRVGRWSSSSPRWSFFSCLTCCFDLTSRNWG